jgi:hypothetical protein
MLAARQAEKGTRMAVVTRQDFLEYLQRFLVVVFFQQQFSERDAGVQVGGIAAQHVVENTNRLFEQLRVGLAEMPGRLSDRVQIPGAEAGPGLISLADLPPLLCGLLPFPALQVNLGEL